MPIKQWQSELLLENSALSTFTRGQSASVESYMKIYKKT